MKRDRLVEDIKTLQSVQYQNATLNKEKDELQEKVRKLSESQRTERDHLSKKFRLEEIRTLKKSEEERSKLGDVNRLENELKKMIPLLLLSSKKIRQEKEEMAARTMHGMIKTLILNV
ncbi:hypothetical protein E2C01_017158 [Portunus trituberculatus]|uniref:Uncharacterized protein n=1 Tax=Portunus trituberculatus TaxID=210409 RepID=A0A5B7DRP2_PORTR|nr:hypothetical protein [Portunus trituberculatus]